MEKLYNIKIDKLYFGLITTKDGYIKNFEKKRKYKV